MQRAESLGSGSRFVSRGVFRSRPGREKENTDIGGPSGKLRASGRIKARIKTWGLILAVGAAGLADVTHSVVRGDTLSGIARRYGSSIGAIAAANNISNVNLIHAGRALMIPGVGSQAHTQVQGDVIVHKVVRGETLSGLAKKYETTVSRLVSMNGIRNPQLIRAGQSIKAPIPDRLRLAAAAAAPPPPQAPVQAAAIAVPPSPGAIPNRPPTTTISGGHTVSAGAEQLIERYSREYGLDPALMKGLAWQESGFKQHVVSYAGAVGVMQVMPETGSFISRHLLKKPVNLHDMEQNIEAGVSFFAYYLSKTNGDEYTAVAGYFQGLRSVWQNGISERTRRYADAVMALRARFA